MPYSVPWPPGAVTSVPAEKRSARPGAPAVVRCSARISAAKRWSVNMSSSVVTPNSSARSSASPNECVCASISPGRSVRPAPSITSAPGGTTTSAPTAAINPSRTTTVARGRVRSPSNTRTSLNATTAPCVPDRPCTRGVEARTPVTTSATPTATNTAAYLRIPLSPVVVSNHVGVASAFRRRRARARATPTSCLRPVRNPRAPGPDRSA